jgi:hypothetical protein
MREIQEKSEMEDGTRHLHSHLDRWMMFVDGEGFTGRVEELARSSGAGLGPETAYKPGVYYWFPFSYPGEVLSGAEGNLILKTPPIRALYFTTAAGGEKGLDEARRSIWKLGFEPKVFRKTRRAGGSRATSVAMAADILSNAYLDNFDIAVLITGDSAFVPVLEELKRQGKVVYVVFPSLKRADMALQYAADVFISLDSRLLSQFGREGA